MASAREARGQVMAALERAAQFTRYPATEFAARARGLRDLATTAHTLAELELLELEIAALDQIQPEGE